jgi:uncharacterized protein
MLNRVVRAWMQLVVAHPLLIILASLAICALLLTGIPKFKLDASVKKYIGDDSPVVVHLNWLEQEYVDDNSVLLMIKPAKGTVFDAATLDAVRQFTNDAWLLPFVRRVDSLSNFQHTQVSGDDLVVNDLIPMDMALTSKQIHQVQHIALAEPRLVGSLLSSDGKVTAINLLFNIDISNDADREAIITGVEKLKSQLMAAVPDTRLYEAGFVVMMDNMTKTSAADGKKLYSVSILMIVISLALFFRSLACSLVVVAVGILAVAVSIGGFGHAGGYLTPPTAMGVLMVLILGLVDGVHIVKNAMKLRASGSSRPQAILESTTRNFIPIGLTSITTAIGFLSFNFNDFVGIQLMGNYVASGVMIAFILSISLLPAILCYCPVKTDKPPRKNLSLRAVTHVIETRYRLILGITCLTILVAGVGITFNTLDDSISRHLKASHPFRQDVRQIENDLTGAMTAIYSFKSPSPQGVADPEYAAKVEQFAQWLRQQPGVRHVSTYTDTLKQLNQDLNGGDPANYHLPDSADMAAQYLLLYEMSLPYGLDLTNQINLDKSASRVVAYIEDFTFQQTKVFLQSTTQWLARNAPEFDPAANSAILAANMTVEATIWNTLEGAMVALAVIGLVLVATFRAFLPGLLCVLSVLAPMVVTFGVWGLTVGIVDLPATLALCMVIGISVDFSVHFISKYLHGIRQQHLSSRDSIRYTFEQVSAPLITSTLALGIGFLVMIAGQFQFGARLGLLTAICIFLSLVTTFSFLPSTILFLKDKR